MKWLGKLSNRWNVSSTRAILILIVFACTGFTVMFLKKPLLNLFMENDGIPLYVSILYYILILPIYNLILLVYGFIFGQFDFFWNFEKRFFKRIFRIK